MICHSCSKKVCEESVKVSTNFVSSDCQPVNTQLEYIGCLNCGLVQKNISHEWRKVCSDIYENYRIYHQGGGNEQKVASVKDGSFIARSELLTLFVKENVATSQQFAALDIGCGNGAFLSHLKIQFPSASITGAELNEKFKNDILNIAPDARFISSGNLDTLEECFQLVSLIHCLEHIDAPVEYLKSIAHLVAEDGYLLIEVPDAELNPFDLVIADHASHFSKAALNNIVEQAGFDLVQAGNLVLGKEITVLARPNVRKRLFDQPAVKPFLDRNFDWLQSMIAYVGQASETPVFGIFGSSIAASWFANALGDRVKFFVDEDSSRVGREHMGKPILAPSHVPPGATVFFGMEPNLAREISARYSDYDFACALPALIETSPKH